MNSNTIEGVPILSEHELPTATITLLEGDIAWVRYKPYEEEITKADARKHTEVFRIHGKGRPQHILLDFRDIYVNFSTEAREYFAKDPGHAAIRKSQAMVLNALSQRLVASFYLRFHRPTCPAKVVASPQEAFMWFKELDRSNNGN